MNTKNIISYGINNTILIISNNIIITMGSATWRLSCPCATWLLGCLSQSGFLPRPKRQVTLVSTPRIRATQAPGGTQVFPNGMWRWGCHSQSGILPRPKRQVALGSAPGNRAAQALGGSRVCPAQGPDSLSASCPCLGSARCLLPMACSPTKTCVDIFSMSNALPWKDNPTPPSLPLQLFVTKAVLSLHCSNLQCFKSR
jgi:hypothetical protein